MSIALWPALNPDGLALRVRGADIIIVDKSGGRVYSGSVCPAPGQARRTGYTGLDKTAAQSLGLDYDDPETTVPETEVARLKALMAGHDETKPATKRPGPTRPADHRPLFTRRHYNAMAVTLREVFLREYARREGDETGRANTETVAIVIQRMAEDFAKDNPRFTVEMFYAEAGCLPDGTPDYSIADNNPASPEGE